MTTTVDPAIPVSSPPAAAWVDREAYPFRSRFLELAPGQRVHYVDEGQGETLLFVHGTPTWSFEWRHAIRAFSATHRCVAMDHLGFGLSDRPRDFPYTPGAHADVLQRFVAELGLTHITLVVHDFGGPIGLPLALERSGLVRRLVLLNTWMWPFDDDRAMVRTARLAGGSLGRLLYRYANVSLRLLMPSVYADRRKLTPRIHQQYLAPFRDGAARERVLWALARALLGSSAYYGALWRERERLRELPALVLWGTKDTAFGRSQLDRWRTVLSDADVVELPVGHWPQEEAPERVHEAIRAFLSRGVALR